MTPKHTQPWSLNYSVTYSYPNWPQQPQSLLVQQTLAQLAAIDQRVLEMTEFPQALEMIERACND